MEAYPFCSLFLSSQLLGEDPGPERMDLLCPPLREAAPRSGGGILAGPTGFLFDLDARHG